MQRLTVDNNVRVSLSNGASTTDTSITFANAVDIFKNPPAPVGGFPGLATIVDSLSTPTKIEIITYTGVTNNGNGTRTLTGCLRGRDGSTAQTWSPGAILICAPTRMLVDPSNVALLDQQNPFTVAPQVPQLIFPVALSVPRIAIPAGEERVASIRSGALIKVALTNLPSSGDTFHDLGIDFGGGNHDVVDVSFALYAVGSGSGAAIVRISDPLNQFQFPVNHGNTYLVSFRMVGSFAAVFLGAATFTASNPFGITS